MPERTSPHQSSCRVVRPLPFKAHKITGFSPEQFERHFEDVYGGIVRALNAVERDLVRQPTDARLRADQLRLANAALLHEVYFDAIGEEGGVALDDRALQHAIDAAFGDMQTWQEGFESLALAGAGGWAILAWAPDCGRLVNLRTSSDDVGLFGAVPILALDMADHACRDDFGDDRKGYVRAFLDSLAWDRIANRFHRTCPAIAEDATEAPDQVTVDALKERLDRGEDVLVIDVRHDDDRERYRHRIMRTQWRDSFDVASWAGDMPTDRPVVVYCMYGFWVSQKAAAELRDHGIDAKSLVGGVTSWRAMGYPSSDNVF